MTIRKEPSEQLKWEMIKATRAAIRLKHSLAADRELNDVLPEMEAAFDDLLQNGVLPEEVNLGQLASEVVNRGA